MLYIVDLTGNKRVDFRVIMPGYATYGGEKIPKLVFDLVVPKVPYQGDEPDKELYLKVSKFILQDGNIVVSNEHRYVNATLIISADEVSITGVPEVDTQQQEGLDLSGKELSMFLGKSGGYYFTMVFAPEFAVLNGSGGHLVNASFMRVMTL